MVLIFLSSFDAEFVRLLSFNEPSVFLSVYLFINIITTVKYFVVGIHSS